jgi:hypothetical protein
MLLGDVTISREPREIIEKQHCNAEWALKLQCDLLVEQFDAIEEDYLRERKNDVLQVVERIFKNLDGHAPQLPAPGDLLDDTILVAHDLSPADMVYFKDSNFAAFVTDVGEPLRTAILGQPRPAFRHRPASRSRGDPRGRADHRRWPARRADRQSGRTGAERIPPAPACLARCQAQAVFHPQVRCQNP